MASTITRDTWTNDTGSASTPVGDGTVINNSALQNNVYARVDEMFSGAGSYVTCVFGGSVSAAAQPQCFVYNSAVQSVNDSTDTVLTFDSESYDIGTLHSTAVNTGRITIPSGQGGLYLIIGQAGFAANATGIRELSIKVNGTSKFFGSTQVSNAAGGVQVLNVHGMYRANAADYFELIAYQSSGGALNVGSATVYYAAQFSAVRLVG